MSKTILQDLVWAGTESSLQTFLDIDAAIDEKLYAGPPASEGEEDNSPYLLDKRGSVGVVSVRGPLINRDNRVTRAFGISTYPAIREAVMAAATDPEITHILMDIESGGGAVNGVADVANLVSTVNSRIKPVTSFTDGSMASAAYWIGCSAGSVYSSKTSTVGSIGVIATHMEQSKALKDEGIGVTVMRAGKYKALANSVEPLSDAAKAQIQEQLDGAYTVFVQHVADARNVSYDMADKNMAQGREFFGASAVAAGLVDGIETFDSLFSKLSQDTIDKRAHVVNNSQQFRFTGQSGSSEVTMAGRQALTEQQIAALAESAGAAEEAAASMEAPAVEAAAAQDAEGVAAPSDSAPHAGNDQLVSYLQAQVKERDDALVQARVQVATLTESLAASEAVVGDLAAIAAKSLNNMQVALGGAALDLSAQSPLAVITEHKRVSAQFLSKFKAGGVAAVDAANAEVKEPVLDPLHMARIAATRVK